MDAAYSIQQSRTGGCSSVSSSGAFAAHFCSRLPLSSAHSDTKPCETPCRMGYHEAWIIMPCEISCRVGFRAT